MATVVVQEAMVRPFVCCRPVLQAVANLYLRRQIIFERLS